ncbi:MAG: four helix bundle protein [Planctomycetes bacterium]|nr:four helix bundle protein [Planctomycetota bacterium]
MGATRFTDLRVWQAAVDLCVEIYHVTRGFPPEERYGLALQMRRASNSIGANIAEGFGRWAPRDQARFYEIAKGSAEELRHHLIVSSRLGMLRTDPEFDRRIDSICGMLHNLRQIVLSKPKLAR